MSVTNNVQAPKNSALAFLYPPRTHLVYTIARIFVSRACMGKPNLYIINLYVCIYNSFLHS